MAAASAHPQFTTRFWERYGSDELIDIRSGLETVLDERARQFSLFEPPAVIEIAQARAAAAAAVPMEYGQVLSPSQARCYLDCSAKWWFKYAIGLPDPQNGNLALGKAVHAAVEHAMRAKMETKDDLPAAEYVEAFEGSWDVEAAQTSFAEDDDVDELAGMGRRLVEKFATEAAPRIAPAAVERRVLGEIAGVQVQGYVDLLDTSGRVIDVKTAARKPNDVDPSYAFQLATYRQLPLVPVESDGPFTPRANGEATIITLVKTKTPQLIEQTYKVSTEDMLATQKQYPLVQAGIRNGLYLPNRRSMLCSRRNCNFWQTCQSEFGGKVSA